MAKIDKQDLSLRNYVPGQKLDEGENRRMRGDRIVVHFPIFAKSEQKDALYGYLECLNLSWSGLMLETNLLLEKDDVLYMEFTLPESDVPLQIKSKIIWTAPHPHVSELHIAGVAFLEMDINLRRMLQGFILEHLE